MEIEEKRIFMTDNPSIHLMVIGVENLLKAIYQKEDCIIEISALMVLIPEDLLVKNNINNNLANKESERNKRINELEIEYNKKEYDNKSSAHKRELINEESKQFNYEMGLYLIGEVSKILNELKSKEKINELLKEKSKSMD